MEAAGAVWICACINVWYVMCCDIICCDMCAAGIGMRISTTSSGRPSGVRPERRWYRGKQRT